jgi:uncharacterized phage protein (TIGR02218 family)
MVETITDQTQEQLEKSEREPVDIYKIWNNYKSYYLTSADAPITFGGQIYSPAAIKKGSTSKSSDLNVSSLTVNIHHLQEDVSRYLSSSPLDQTWILVNRLYRDQTNPEAIVYFYGLIKDVDVKGQVASLSCIGIESLLRVLIPKYRYQPKCNYKLFSDHCGVDPAGHLITRTVESISADGLTVTVNSLSGFADQYYRLGYLEVSDSSPRMIVSQIGKTLQLRHLILELEVGDTVTLLPGCDKVPSTCRDKFYNMNRFFGFFTIPDDNPCLWTS